MIPWSRQVLMFCRRWNSLLKKTSICLNFACQIKSTLSDAVTDERRRFTVSFSYKVCLWWFSFITTVNCISLSFIWKCWWFCLWQGLLLILFQQRLWEKYFNPFLSNVLEVKRIVLQKTFLWNDDGSWANLLKICFNENETLINDLHVSLIPLFFAWRSRALEFSQSLYEFSSLHPYTAP